MMSADAYALVASSPLPQLLAWAALVAPAITLVTLAARAAVWKDRIMRRLEECERAVESAPPAPEVPPSERPGLSTWVEVLGPVLIAGAAMELTRRYRKAGRGPFG